jgi:hypothetical protein
VWEKPVFEDVRDFILHQICIFYDMRWEGHAVRVEEAINPEVKYGFL